MTNPDWAERLQRTRKREYDKGIEAERSRIIKLLEEWGEKAGCFCCASDAAASEIIAFIKGEITSEEL